MTAPPSKGHRTLSPVNGSLSVLAVRPPFGMPPVAVPPIPPVVTPRR